MLHNITPEGQLTWHCPHCSKDEPNTAHISHEEVQYPSGSSMVALPRCACGTQTFLKVDFTEQELLPPIIHYDGNGKISHVTVQGAPNFTIIHAHMERILTQVDPRTITGEKKVIYRDGSLFEETMFQVIDGISSHPAVAHHVELAKQLEAIGKTIQTDG